MCKTIIIAFEPFIKQTKLIIVLSICTFCISTNYASSPFNYTLLDSLTTKATKSKTSSRKANTLPSKAIKDSILIKDTTLNSKFIDTVSLPIYNSEIDDEVIYDAKDSIVYDVKGRKLFLYKDSKITYTDMIINSEKIDFDWNTMNLTANEDLDSAGKIFGSPVYKQGEKEYLSHKMIYNFKSKRGKIFDVVTQEGEGILHCEEVKRDADQNWNIKNGKYTTCKHENPHFYFFSPKLKLITNKLIVSGPTNLVISGVSTPPLLPFALFQIRSGRSSGLILPQQYLFAPIFTLKGTGYYWAVNDKIGATFTTDIAFNGSYGFQAAMDYDIKYKSKGSIAAGINRLVKGDLDDPKTPRPTIEYSFAWTHTQSPKAHPYFSFTSSVNFRTSSFFQNSLVTDSRLTQGIVSSNINFSKKFRGKPYSMTFGLNGRQDLATKIVKIDLPNFNFYLPFSPFKSKIETPDKKWYEKINMTYSTVVQSILTTYDSLLFTKKALDNVNYGINHNLAIGWNSKFFKYLNLSLNAGMADKMYFNRTVQYWDAQALDTQKIGLLDTIYKEIGRAHV